MYGDFGCVSKIILPNGNENNYEYDSMQRLVGTKISTAGISKSTSTSIVLETIDVLQKKSKRNEYP